MFQVWPRDAGRRRWGLRTEAVGSANDKDDRIVLEQSVNGAETLAQAPRGQSALPDSMHPLTTGAVTEGDCQHVTSAAVSG